MTDSSGIGSSGSASPGIFGTVDLNDPVTKTFSRQGMGLITDTLDISFVTLQGELGVYKGESGRPTLAPVSTSVHDFMNNPGSGLKYKAAYSEVMNGLPEGIREQLTKELAKKPPDEPDPEYAALGQAVDNLAVLVSVANALTDTVVKPTSGIAPLNPEQQLQLEIGIVTKIVQNSLLTLEFSYKALSLASKMIDEGTLVDANNKTTGNEATGAASTSGGISTDSMKTYLSLIGDAIASARSYLATMQQLDSKNSQKIALAQREAIQANLADTLQKIADEIAAQKKQGQLSLIMKICGPIVAVLAAILTVVTLGAAAPLAVAVVIAISAISVAISIADSATGFMTKAIQSLVVKLNDALSSESDAMKYFIQALIVVAIIAVGVAIASAGGAAVASSVAESVAAGSVKQLATAVVAEGVAQELVSNMIIEASRAAVISVIKEQAMNYTFQFVMASNLILNVVASAARKAGASDEAADKWGMGFQIALSMAAMGFVKGKQIAGSGGSTKVLGNSTRNVALVSGMLEAGTSATKNTYSMLINIELAKLALEKSNLEASIELIQAALDVLELAQKDLIEAIKEASEGGAGLTKLFNDTVQGLSNSMTQLYKAA